jgi:hypothetical protein
MVERRLDIGGAVTFWSLADWSDRQRLRAHFVPLGLELLVPEPRQAPAALRAALEEVLGGPRVLVRPLATRDGFAVVQEDRGVAANLYETTLTARVNTNEPPTLACDPYNGWAPRIEQAFRLHLARTSAAQLSAALVRVIEAMGGTRLRPSGAVYCVPGHRLDDWAAVAHAVEQCGEGRPSAVYLLRHRLDGDAIRAVRDAVVADVQAEAHRIRDEVATGDLGGRALETRKKQASDLREKVLLYEELLSVSLDGLHQAVDCADQAAATAALLLGAQAGAPSTAVAGRG